MGLLTPDYCFKDVTHITPAFLKEKNIKGLVLDVDNTLTGHGSQELTPEVAQWVQRMRSEGIYMGIASNNTKKRVAPFANALNMEFSSFSCKPLPGAVGRLCRKWKLPKAQVALVGDQIYTDALAATFAGVTMLLVLPMYRDIKRSIRFKRWLEKPVMQKYYKKGGQCL